MNNENFFKDIFESIPDYKKIVLLLFLIKNDKKKILEVGFIERDINRLSFGFENILTEQHEEYLDFIRNEQESVIEKFLNK